jgi:hypothetical protein
MNEAGRTRVSRAPFTVINERLLLTRQSRELTINNDFRSRNISNISRLTLTILILCLPSFGEDSGVAQADPKTFFKIVAAIEQSKLPGLKTNKDGDGTTYHLRGIYYLGQVRRDGKTYSVAQVSFVRSSPPGRDVPPPRGHGFVVLLDSSFRIVAHGRSNHGFLHMIGSKLMEGDSEVADFASREPGVRFSGFVHLNMAYPFADRITEEERNSKNPEPPALAPKPQTEAAPSAGDRPSN